MNKEFYIQTQIQSSFINKILLENDASNAFRILTSNFELLSLADAIDSYLNMPTNMIFLYYFDDIKDKLKEVLETCIFKLNNVTDEYLMDEVYQTQMNIIEIIKSLEFKIDKKEKKEIEETLLLSRGIEDEINLNRKEFLKLCYQNDYDVFLYLNSASETLKTNKEKYVLVLMSLYYYFNQIVFVNNEDIANAKLQNILQYNEIIEGKEFIDYYKQLVENSYNELLKIDFDEFIEQNLEEDEETKKERLKNIKNCKIYDFETCKTKMFNKKQKGE